MPQSTAANSRGSVMLAASPREQLTIDRRMSCSLIGSTAFPTLPVAPAGLVTPAGPRRSGRIGGSARLTPRDDPNQSPTNLARRACTPRDDPDQSHPNDAGSAPSSQFPSGCRAATRDRAGRDPARWAPTRR
ncbi:hypothetical protein Raf01_54260 [Rugosimonospora africana]|uniref:Uncharacterized protein n=1 Tax=Rugosimonospora africana TaxID=556532 RepID=A0A8J3QUE5_9ACTN|nr:hypothetical protein Raf01_54260 [Rugosimonospora africana]